MEGSGREEAGSSSAPKTAQCENGNDAIASCHAGEVEGTEERKDGSDQEEIESEDEEHEFVPGPLLSLKDELEKDKVIFLSLFLIILLINGVLGLICDLGFVTNLIHFELII